MASRKQIKVLGVEGHVATGGKSDQVKNCQVNKDAFTGCLGWWGVPGVGDTVGWKLKILSQPECCTGKTISQQQRPILQICFTVTNGETRGLKGRLVIRGSRA